MGGVSKRNICPMLTFLIKGRLIEMRQFIIMPFLMVFIAYILTDTWYMVKSTRKVIDTVRMEKIDTVRDTIYNTIVRLDYFNK